MHLKGEKRSTERQPLVHAIPDGNWSTRNYNLHTNIKCKKLTLFSQDPLTFTLISLEMKGQAWRKYFCLLGTRLNYHKTLDAY